MNNNKEFIETLEQIEEEDDYIITEEKLRQYGEEMKVLLPVRFFLSEFVPVDNQGNPIPVPTGDPEFNVFIITFMFKNVHTGQVFPRTWRGKFHMIPCMGGFFKISSSDGNNVYFTVKDSINLGLVRFGVDRRD
jgi:hypothetical protein